MKTGPLRFAFLTVFSTLVSALAGGVLICVSMLAWQAGEIHVKGGIIRASTSPIQFYLAMGVGSLFGLILLLAAPWLSAKMFASSDERAQLTQHNPKVYGPVRLSIRIAILVVATAIFSAWLA
jgi:hypothetical protein